MDGFIRDGETSFFWNIFFVSACSAVWGLGLFFSCIGGDRTEIQYYVQQSYQVIGGSSGPEAGTL